MAHDTPTIEAQPRERLGSTHARHLRAEGRLPAVIYGRQSEPLHISVDEKTVLTHLRHGIHVLKLQVGGREPETCLVKDLQHGYLGDNVIHVDFARVALDEEVEVHVQLSFVGVPPVAQRAGAMLHHDLTGLAVMCLVNEIPDEIKVDLSTIGGLVNLKRWLKQRENIFSEQAAEFGLESPRGVLMLGVQGAGKSLCAKAIATAWRRPLLRLDPGVLYDRYVGESERRLRSALGQAELMAPIILWIDEIEKGFASAASQSTDGGLSQRMFGTLLTWMQEHEAPVFLIATANNIDALPPELLRKGRFDEIFFVDLPAPPVRREIFAIHLRKRNRNPDDFDLEALAEGSSGYSGAEIEQAIIAALHGAFADSTEIDTPRIVAAVAGSPPLSVTMAERTEQLRAWARSRCVPAD